MIACPHCQRPFDLETAQISDASVRLFCDRCGKLFSLAEASRVLVVHESEETYAAVARIVSATGHAAVHVRDGRQALALVGTTNFALVLVDVAVQGVYAFELVPKLKSLALQPHVVLIASVYDRAAYKRAPTSLYGADEYIEQHHLPDKLPQIVARIFAGTAPPISVDAVQEERAVLRDAARESLSPGSRDEQLRQARTLARRVLMDVSLYQGDVWALGLAGRNLRELLQKPLADAKVFVAERLPAALKGADAPDFIEEALAQLLAEQGSKEAAK